MYRVLFFRSSRRKISFSRGFLFVVVEWVVFCVWFFDLFFGFFCGVGFFFVYFDR